MLPTPVEVLTNKNGNIIKVRQEKNLPICKFCKKRLDYLNGRIEWIEEILKTPFKDKRKRITDLIIIPYLTIIQGLPEKEVVHRVKEWFKLSDYSEYKYKKRIRYQFRRTKNIKMKPMGKLRFKEELLNQ